MLRRVVVLAFLAGCGSAATVQLDELIDEIVAARCDHAVACLEMPDAATCQAVLPADYLLQSIVADIRARHIAYNPVAAARCIDEIRAKSCGFTGGRYYSELVGSTDRTDPCLEMLQGQIPDHGQCNESAACADHGTCNGPPCDHTTTCCTGTCDAMPMVGFGEDCSRAYCADDAYCNSEHVCAPQVTEDRAPCDATDACMPPLECEFRAHQSIGTCGPSARAPPVPRVPIGAACDEQTVTCVGWGSCLDGVCVAALPLGATCSATAGPPQCLGLSQCIDSVCTAVPSTPITPCP